MEGRVYLDPGDQFAGAKVPPEPVTVLTRWATLQELGPAPTWSWLRWTPPPRAGGPQNARIRHTRGQEEVIPTRTDRFWRLRIPREPVNLREVLAVYGGCVHRACDWPGCAALMDAVAVLSGEPGSPEGWLTHRAWRMCPEHTDVWTDRSHLPAWVGKPPVMVCSCGRPLPGATLGDITAAYRQHLTKARLS